MMYPFQPDYSYRAILSLFQENNFLMIKPESTYSTANLKYLNFLCRFGLWARILTYQSSSIM